MSGFFGVAAKDDCVADLFYGTDYHSHLGTVRGGIVVQNDQGFTRFIKDITNSQFRSKFESDLSKIHGSVGIGIISDYEDQPLIINSHLGTYALVTVGRINNLDELANQALNRSAHFSEMSGNVVNPTELVAMLINDEVTFEAGIQRAQQLIEGSCSLLLLTDNCIYAARDKLGRTPIVVGRKEGAYCATLETSALPNLDYEIEHYLGPGEIMRITVNEIKTLVPPGEEMQICSFLWVYYGYPASNYENINAEVVRNRCGATLAQNNNCEVDFVAGIPDSGAGHAIGYANAANIPYRRPLVKYTPTWPRSFMPQDQRVRDLVAKMKLIPIRELIAGQRLLFCDDSIVRGTQLKDIVQRLYDYDAKEIHMRVACPPLLYGCKYLNFSRSRSIMDLATRKAIAEVGNDNMVEGIRKRLGFTSLKYQKLDDLVSAIGLPKEKLCTYCFDGCDKSCKSCKGVK